MKTSLRYLCLFALISLVSGRCLAEGDSETLKNENSESVGLALNAFSPDLFSPGLESELECFDNRYKKNEKWYFQVQGGANYIVAECLRSGPASKRISGTYSFSVGKHFSPFIGGRLHFIGGGDKGRFYATKDSPTYRFNHIAGATELTMNFLNLLNDTKKHEESDWSLLFIVGPGVVRTFSFDTDGVKYPNPNKDRGNFDPRYHLFVYGGIDLSCKISKNMELGFETGLMCIHDRYNGFDSSWRMDALLNGMLGIRYTIQ